MKKNKSSPQPLLLKELVESLSQAEGACSQLIHQMNGDARWMIIRDAVHLSRQGVLLVAEAEIRRAPVTQPSV